MFKSENVMERITEIKDALQYCSLDFNGSCEHAANCIATSQRRFGEIEPIAEKI